MNYCMDSSALLDGWRRHYPPDIVPDLPEMLHSLVVEGRLLIPEDVVKELAKKDDDLTAWVKAQAEAIVPLDEAIQEAATEILARFPRLIESRSGRSGADPFLVATAKVRNAMVVTGEEFANSLEKPRIPDVCKALSIRCGRFVDIIRGEKWRFGWKRT
jgi:predicted nucleic acid-binding protein